MNHEKGKGVNIWFECRSNVIASTITKRINMTKNIYTRRAIEAKAVI
jgi:hypothetical protein